MGIMPIGDWRSDPQGHRDLRGWQLFKRNAQAGWTVPGNDVRGNARSLSEHQKQKNALWAGSLNSGARTWTNAAGVEQRACRAGPEGVSGVPRIIERSSMESPYCRKQKTSP